MASGPGYPAHDLYVRRFWTAVLGAPAVAELLRIAEAGRKGNRIPRPIYLQALMELGLVHVSDGGLQIGDLIPPVPGGLIRRLMPSIRYAHERWQPPLLLAKSPPAGQSQGNQFADRKANGDPEVGSTVNDEHGDQPGDEAADPGTGELTGRSVSDQGLPHQLSDGAGNDANRGQGGDGGNGAEFGPKQKLHHSRADQPPHHTGQPDEKQAESDQPQEPLAKIGLSVHPNQKRQKPALKVVNKRQRSAVEQERSEDDAA